MGIYKSAELLPSTAGYHLYGRMLHVHGTLIFHYNNFFFHYSIIEYISRSAFLGASKTKKTKKKTEVPCTKTICKHNMLASSCEKLSFVVGNNKDIIFVSLELNMIVSVQGFM